MSTRYEFRSHVGDVRHGEKTWYLYLGHRGARAYYREVTLNGALGRYTNPSPNAAAKARREGIDGVSPFAYDFTGAVRVEFAPDRDPRTGERVTFLSPTDQWDAQRDEAEVAPEEPKNDTKNDPDFRDQVRKTIIGWGDANTKPGRDLINAQLRQLNLPPVEKPSRVVTVVVELEAEEVIAETSTDETIREIAEDTVRNALRTYPRVRTSNILSVTASSIETRGGK